MAARDHQHPRRQRLVNPRLQLKIIAVFLLTGMVVQALQFAMLWRSAIHFAECLPGLGPQAELTLHQQLLTVFGTSSLLLVPMTLLVGIVITFPIAGPLYRMRKHLEAIAAGHDPGECRIRKTDELHDVCASLNAAVARLREPRPATVGPERALLAGSTTTRDAHADTPVAQDPIASC
ncbi:MAG: hypothetical protein AB7O52_04715 [Planctomycetota bacterium]